MALKQLINRFRKKEPSIAPITIVSGLPRSGTSLMMQMLAAGGMEIITDEERVPDPDNPRGYYELERVKKLKDGDTSWLGLAPGKVVKVISPLLDKLPPGYQYRVIFVQRELEEVLASQKQMLSRRGEDTDRVSDEEMKRLFEQHLVTIQSWLVGQKNFKVLYLQYSVLINDPNESSRLVTEFLDNSLDLAKMSQVPDPQLYRQKSGV